MLLDNGLITDPVSCVLRKGREHYVCKRNLLYHLTFVNNASLRRELERLLLPGSAIDLAEVGAGGQCADLPTRLKRKICVPARCSDSCKYRSTCQFLAFREQAGSFRFDIQVTNHQLLIADTINRANGRKRCSPRRRRFWRRGFGVNAQESP
jgi:ATP-dependent DNA helicase DinG